MWLDPVRTALDAAGTPIDVFFRDDDAGWNDPRLFALLDVFEERLIPLDLAVIPQSLTSALAAALLNRKRSQPVGLHQHGYAHANHEPEGRKFEFGPSRSPEQQFRDISQGGRRLREQLGDAGEPMFTPPWNRCTQATVEALRALDFAVLSRDHGAQPLHLGGLGELCVGVDWCRHSGDRDELGRRLAAAMVRRPTTGILLHHAGMPNDDLEELQELLSLLQRHDSARCHLMAALSASDAPDAKSACAG